jgi:predicted phage tail protein
VDCLDKNVDLGMKCQGKDIDQENLLYKLNEGDITLAIVPAGSKKAFKIIAAIALFVYAPQLAGYGTQTVGTTVVGGGGATMGMGGVALVEGSATALTVIQSLAINLGMAGLAELMAPDPSVDDPASAPSDYLYTGSASVSNKYDPIPVLYGELRVPGKLVDFNVTNGIFLNPTNVQEANGDISVFDDSKFTRAGKGN